MEPFNSFYDRCPACIADEDSICEDCERRPFAIGPDAVELLRAAADGFGDMLRSEADELAHGTEFADLLIVPHVLPDCHATRYTPELVLRFVAAMDDVAAKFTTEPSPYLRCTAEELAGHALIGRARDVIADSRLDHELAGEPLNDAARAEADLNWLHEMAFEDWDVLMLFERSMDGFENAPELASMHFANLGALDWFQPFQGGDELYRVPTPAP